MYESHVPFQKIVQFLFFQDQNIRPVAARNALLRSCVCGSSCFFEVFWKTFGCRKNIFGPMTCKATSRNRKKQKGSATHLKVELDLSPNVGRFTVLRQDQMLRQRWPHRSRTACSASSGKRWLQSESILDDFCALWENHMKEMIGRLVFRQ